LSAAWAQSPDPLEPLPEEQKLQKRSHEELYFQ
jgi:hypothetical protein